MRSPSATPRTRRLVWPAAAALAVAATVAVAHLWSAADGASQLPSASAGGSSRPAPSVSDSQTTGAPGPSSTNGPSDPSSTPTDGPSTPGPVGASQDSSPPKSSEPPPVATSSAPPVVVTPDPSLPSATAGDLAAFGWSGVQQAQPNRVQLASGASVPARGTAGAPATALRVTLAAGDVTATGGYSAPRTEVYGRMPVDTASPATDWPDPVDSERWYSFQVYVPSDFALATGTQWITITQWKGRDDGSPPVALEIKRDNWRLGGTRTNAGLVPNDGILRPLKLGQWTSFRIGLHLSLDPTIGWVQVFIDGSEALPRTHMATMDLINGQADPVYLKQGLYASREWTVGHVLYFGPMSVS